MVFFYIYIYITVFSTTDPRYRVVQVAKNDLVHHRRWFSFLTQQNVRALFRLDFEYNTVPVFGRRDVLIPEIRRRRHNELFCKDFFFANLMTAGTTAFNPGGDDRCYRWRRNKRCRSSDVVFLPGARESERTSPPRWPSCCSTRTPPTVFYCR